MWWDRSWFSVRIIICCKALPKSLSPAALPISKNNNSEHQMESDDCDTTDDSSTDDSGDDLSEVEDPSFQ